MRIYRIQTVCNAGYYNKRKTCVNEKLFNELRYEYSNMMKDGTERYQLPYDDVDTPLHKWYMHDSLYGGSKFLFGFASIKDLYTWVCPASIGIFEASGLYIYEYDIPDKFVLHGTRQVVFDPEQATNITQISHKKLRHSLNTQ